MTLILRDIICLHFALHISTCMSHPSIKAFGYRLTQTEKEKTEFNMNHCNTLPGMPKVRYTVCVSKIKIHEARMQVRTVMQQQESVLPSSSLASAFGPGSISLSILICSCRGGCVCSISPLIVMKARSVFRPFPWESLQGRFTAQTSKLEQGRNEFDLLRCFGGNGYQGVYGHSLAPRPFTRLACYETLPQSHFRIRSNAGSQKF